jgi:hypothetical protein
MVARYAQRSVILNQGRVAAEVPTTRLGYVQAELLEAGIRLPEIYALEGALGWPPVFSEIDALAASIGDSLASCGAR